MRGACSSLSLPSLTSSSSPSPSTPPSQWQHPASTSNPPNPRPCPPPNHSSAHQTRTKSPGTAIKCPCPFYLSSTSPNRLTPAPVHAVPPPPLSRISPSACTPSRFNIYILDYCKKRGYHKTASQLVNEADIPPESKPPINAQQGLLFESVSFSLSRPRV